MAMGEYKIVDFDANTGIPNQRGKRALVSEGWKFFNRDGSVACDTKEIIGKMEYRPNCD